MIIILFILPSSSSTIITLASRPSGKTLTPLNLRSDDGSIVMLKVSSSSDALSSIIGTLKTTRVFPAGTITSYGPES